jgi:hypothetical protein
LPRARATALLKAEGVETVILEKDQGGFNRVTQTIIAIGQNQIALANPGQERVLFQPAVVAPPFYSRLTRTVTESTLAKASGAQWQATIKNAKIGTNKDEFAYAKLEDLEPGTVYTKADVLAYLAANTLEVTPVILEGEGNGFEAEVDDDAVEQEAEYLREAFINDKMDDYEDDGDDGVGQAEARYNEDEEQWEAFVGDEDVGGYYTSERRAQQAADERADELRDAGRDARERAHREWLEGKYDVDYFRDEARERLEEQAREDNPEVDNPNATHYGEYVEPGVAQDYKEVFLTVGDVVAKTPYPGDAYVITEVPDGDAVAYDVTQARDNFHRRVETLAEANRLVAAAKRSIANMVEVRGPGTTGTTRTTASAIRSCGSGSTPASPRTAGACCSSRRSRRRSRKSSRRCRRSCRKTGGRSRSSGRSATPSITASRCSAGPPARNRPRGIPSRRK